MIRLGQTSAAMLASCGIVIALWVHEPVGQAQASVAGNARSAVGATYSPVLQEPLENNLYFGDLHLHTNLSPDAFLNGTRSVSPEDAYRFAMGETIEADNGSPARLRKPLDFIAITDHSEYLGVYPLLLEGDPRLSRWDIGKRWAQMLRDDNRRDLILDFAKAIQSDDKTYDVPAELVGSIWQGVAERADRFNRPGRFTALIGYEWTSMINGDNLHRVVLFRGDAEDTTKVVPFTAQD
ncbi:DUF3604 domain-containing protein, partial [Novosphingobium marinum]